MGRKCGNKIKRPKRHKVEHHKVDKCLSKTSAYCARCGKDLLRWGTNATVDHVIPKSQGGFNNVSNYIPLCYECNQNKADTLVYPAFYYYQLNGNSKVIKQQNKNVLSYMLKNISLERIKETPLLFGEILMSAKSVTYRNSLGVEIGWLPQYMHIFFDRIRCNKLPYEILELFDICDIEHTDNLYICYTADANKTVAVFEAYVEDDSIVIKIHYTNHRRIMIRCFLRIVQEFQNVYLNNNLSKVIITGKPKIFFSLRFCDIRECDELDMVHSRLVIDVTNTNWDMEESENGLQKFVEHPEYYIRNSDNDM